MAFTAEATNSGGSSFDTFVINSGLGTGGSSVHVPISVLAWGADSANLAVTDTAAPFPVQLFGNGNASGSPFFVRGVGDSTVPVSGTVTVSSFGQSSVTVASGSITVTNDSSDLLFVSDSATPVFVRGLGDSTVPVSGTVSISGQASVTIASAIPQSSVTVASGAITVTNDSSDLLFVSDSATPVFVRGLGDSTVPVSGTVAISNDSTDQIGVTSHVTSAAAGGAQSTQLALSSLALTVGGMTAVGRLYGLSFSNPDSAVNIWAKVFKDDSAGVTLGTTQPAMNLMIPFGGGREMNFGPAGVAMSSGMSIAITDGAASTAHTAPTTTMFVTAIYAPST